MTPRMSKFPSSDELLRIAKMARDLIVARTDADPVLAGGIAMQMYGSPRFTKDVDFLSTATPELGPELKFVKPISFGGAVFSTPEGIDVDVIVRSDEYAELYEDAVLHPTKEEHGLLVASPEHLAAIKMSAGRDKDIDDLMYLLGTQGIVDIRKARNLIHRTLGGQFAVQQFDAALDEARWRYGHNG